MHADLPSSIEAYYQEVGRAGRDGRPATATPLWHYADVKTREFLIDHVRADDARRSRVGITPEERERRKALEHAKLRRMVAYADTVGCLRATILRYFGDPAAREPVACAAPASAASGSARPTGSSCGKFSRARAPRPYGGRKIAAMLVGHTEGLPAELTRLSTTGLLHDCASRLIEQ